MKQILTPSLQILDAVRLSRRRELPTKGTVVVTVGDLVQPTDTVAKASLQSGVFVVRVTQQLGLESHEVNELSLVKEGDAVTEGQAIARYTGLLGLFSSEIVSPVTGVVEYISELTGHIGIRLPPRELMLQSYLRGRVTEVIPEKGVIIESDCACLQGIFGVGGERSGILKEISVKPDEPVRATSLPDGIEGAILFGGSSIGYGALKLASERGAVGIITGSIDDQALNAYLGYELGVAITGDEKVPLTLIVTEGFGTIPMSERSLALLKRFSGSLASINGATQVRAGALRPEVLIFSEFSHKESVKIPSKSLEVGASVRLIRHPYFGKVGTIVELPHAPQRLDTGAEARVVSVRIGGEETVVVPRANIEII